MWMEEWPWTEIWHHHILTIFEACDNVTHLALQTEFFLCLIQYSSPGVDFINKSDKIPLLCALACNQDLHFTVLDASFVWVMMDYCHVDISHRSPIFNKITHIRLVMINSYEVVISLSHLNRLLHFSLPHHERCHKAKDLQPFLKLKLLKMLVITVPVDNVLEAHSSCKELEKWVRKTRKTDARVYLMELCERPFVNEWEEEMRGGESIWD
jgi:hypothetical protein